MKKLICVLTLLLMASTAIAADVEIKCSVTDSTVTVQAKANGAANKPRGIALDITVNNGATIGSVTPISADYWVFPGTIDINTTTGDVNDYGNPVGDSSTGSITIEMGTLHYPSDVNSVNAPDHSVWIDLLSFDVTEGSGAADVNIVGNALRGKVVKYNANSANVSYTGCQVVFEEPECYAGQSDYAEWEAVGKPLSWCYPRQCYGDADDTLNTYGRGNTAWVSSEDIGILIAGFRQPYSGDPATDGGDPGTDPDTWIAADFDHTNNTYGRGNTARVSSEDISILIWNFRNAHGTPADDCLD